MPRSSAATVAPLIASSGANPVALTAALALVVGGLYLALGFLRMGWVARFFAKPVLDGFIVGLGLFIAVGQLPKLVGVSKSSGNTLHQLLSVIGDIGSWSWVTVAVGACGLAVLFILGRFVPRVPAALIVAAGSIIAAKVFDLPDHGVAIVRPVPTGFQFVPWTGVTGTTLVDMVPGALGIVIVGFAQSVAIAKAYASKYQYKIDANQELLAYGAASIGAARCCRVTPSPGACRSRQQPTTRERRLPCFSVSCHSWCCSQSCSSRVSSSIYPRQLSPRSSSMPCRG